MLTAEQSRTVADSQTFVDEKPIYSTDLVYASPDFWSPKIKEMGADKLQLNIWKMI